jgi:hypothetical protein
VYKEDRGHQWTHGCKMMRIRDMSEPGKDQRQVEDAVAEGATTEWRGDQEDRDRKTRVPRNRRGKVGRNRGEESREDCPRLHGQCQGDVER